MAAAIYHRTATDIYHTLRDRAATHNDRPFLQLPDDVVTYAEAVTAADRYAAALEDVPGDVIGIQLSNGEEFVALLFAAASVDRPIACIDTDIVSTIGYEWVDEPAGSARTGGRRR